MCNDQDCQDYNPAFPATPGTPCNDNNANTNNDVVTADGCGCAGTINCNLSATFNVPDGCITSSFLLFADANDPYFPPNNPKYTYSYDIQPANTVGSLASIDPRSVTATFNAPGVKTITVTITNPAIPNCKLVKQATFTVIGDSDGDGICDNLDCKPNDPAFPATPGSPCNDGNANTINDVVTSNGCGCQGSPNIPNCTNNITITASNGSIVVTGLDGAPVSSLQVFTSGWSPVYSCFANCGATQTVNVPPGNYIVYAKYYSASYNFLCQKQANITVTTSVCDNVTNGGTIGFGTSCSASIQHCPTSPAPTIGSCVNPSGGSGNLEIVWLKSTTSCTFPTTTAAQIAAGQDPHWTMIPGASGPTYNPGNVSVATCYLRCSRRVGCPIFIESNIISLSISPNCGGGGNNTTPNCANIQITAQTGQITISGLNGAPVTSVQIFNANWTPVHSCFGNCGGPTASYPVPGGTYHVKVNYCNASWVSICEAIKTINVPLALGSYSGESFQFEANKQEEHTELLWFHNGGFHVNEYILEKSLDGTSFESISNSASKGGTSKEGYEGYDFEPSSGDNYYRLKMVDVDGSVYYSEVKLVNFPDLLNYSLFPNPANGFVKFNLEDIVDFEDVTITMFNNLGLEVKRFELNKVYSKYNQMDIRDLQEGHYIVWLNVPGKRPIAKKLMVGRL